MGAGLPPAVSTAARVSPPAVRAAQQTTESSVASNLPPPATQTAGAARLQNTTTASDRRSQQKNKSGKAAMPRDTSGDSLKGTTQRQAVDEVSAGESSVMRLDRDVSAASVVSRQQHNDFDVDIRTASQPSSQSRQPVAADVQRTDTGAEFADWLPPSEMSSASHQCDRPSSSHVRAEEFLQVNSLIVIITIMLVIIVQDLYSTMETEDTDVLTSRSPANNFSLLQFLANRTKVTVELLSWFLSVRLSGLKLLLIINRNLHIGF